MNSPPSCESKRREAAEIKSDWGRGTAPDARAVLASRPYLRADKSIVLDLAYEEYCLRWEAGDRPDPDEFCERFPSLRASLRRLIEAHQFLEGKSRMFALFGDAPPVRWPEPGERVGDFTLVRELGRGAFARVFLATEASTGDRPVALKLSPEGGAEARTMGRLVHPHIVPVLSARYDQPTGLTAVCMPFLGVATLNDVLDRAYPSAQAAPPTSARILRQAVEAAAQPDDPVPETAPGGPALDRGSYVEGVARVACQIADALAFLHQRGVVHRDLKPSNVLLGGDGRARLLDFNLSADERTDASRVGGTLPYMAPEQVRALIKQSPIKDLDERVDLFALGVIVYELLTGKHPFGTPPAVGRSPAEVAPELLRRRQAGCVPLRKYNLHVDARFARVVERCLAFQPGDRPVSAAALAAELKRYLSRPARVKRWAARRPFLVGGACLAALAVTFGGGAAWSWASQSVFDVNAYNQGKAAYQNRDYEAAEHWLTQASRSKDSPAYCWNALGLARLRQCEIDDPANVGLLSTAQAAFIEANRRRPGGSAKAHIAYCTALQGNYPVAARMFDEAIRAGCDTAEVYNDRGFSRSQLTLFPQAEADFSEALKRRPRLQAAHYNRAVVALLKNGLGGPIPPKELTPALDDIRDAIQMGPPQTGDLYLHAAELYAACPSPTQDVPDPGKQAVEFLEKAVANGVDPKSFPDNPYLLKFKDRADFKALLDQKHDSPSFSRELGLVDPVDDSPE